MARGKKTNGKTQVEMVLELLSSGKKVSPININAAVGNKYAAKYISLLRKEGYEIVSIKEGRTVVAYQMTSTPTSEEDEDSTSDAVEVEKTEEVFAEDTSDEEAVNEEVELDETSFAVAEDFDEVTDEELEKLVA